MKVECPYCKEKYNISRKQIGMEATCAMCNSTFVLYVEGVEPYKPMSAEAKRKIRNIIFGILFLILAGGGGAYYYFNIYTKAKPQETEVKNTENNDIAAIFKTKWMSSANNLKQIGMSIKSYTISNGEKFPDSLNTLVTSNELTDKAVFVAPFDNRTKLASGEMNPENISYAYFGKGGTSSWNNMVVIGFEKPWLLPDGWNKLNVMYADGAVKEVTLEGLNQKTCRQVVEELMKEFSDKAVVETLLKNADQEDSEKKAEPSAEPAESAAGSPAGEQPAPQQ